MSFVKLTWRIVASALLIAIAVTAYLYSQDFRPVVYRVAERTVGEILDRGQIGDDEFKLLFCGTGSPNRSPSRGQPCNALVAAGKLFLFDAGEGAIGKLIEQQAPTGKLEAIFLTHLHSDHMSGVAEVLHNTWLFGRRHEVEVVGPPGTAKVLEGFSLAYQDDLDERKRVLGPENLDGAIVFSKVRDVTVDKNNIKTVYERDGLKIQAFQVEHPDWPYAYGYRIEYRGKTVVISGDTRASEKIIEHARGADLLIHEAVNIEIFNYVGELMQQFGGPISPDRIERISSVHTPTLALAEIATKAGVRNLAVTHLIPALPDLWVAEKFFVAGMDDIYKGELIVARDGMWLDLNKL